MVGLHGGQRFWVVDRFGCNLPLDRFSITDPPYSPDTTTSPIAIGVVERNFVVADDFVVKIGNVQTTVGTKLQIHWTKPWIVAGE